MQTFDYKKYTWIAAIVALLGVAFASLAMGLADIKSLKHPGGTVASITVTGEGEVTALPDVATITATVRETAKTVPEAQKLVEDKITEAMSSMSVLSVDKKDIKTISYTVNPKYETDVIYCITIPCPPRKTTVIGYEVSETIQVKVRKIDSTGDVVGALGKANITEISGPEFTVDDMDKAKAEAKAEAIKKAEIKAKMTAKALHERLGDIMQFSEDNGGYYPAMYGISSSLMKTESSSVTLPQGESVIKSRVTITYSLD
ncbi:MAG: SIMPL domain-containing protein [Candidatus Paceibacterota bacterium]|jgi:hypothetical protein